jgi:glycolate oxidase FAD binding subunit
VIVGTVLRPDSIEAVQAAVRENAHVLPIGGGSKPALATPPDGFVPISVAGLAGVVEYNPGEFVFTAFAGTPVAEVVRVLAANDQYLPFDPPFVDRGATLGGAVAAGLSGPGRCRYGGVRDFILGVRFVTAGGEVVRGRGRVVKNAAGFDLPKLMVGSIGQLGILVELSLKVLPRPEAYASLRLELGSLDAALQAIVRLASLPLDIDALDIDVPEAGARILVRIGGMEAAIPARLDRLRVELGGGELLRGPDEEALWHDAREFTWVPPDWSLAKVPVTPARIAALDEQLPDRPSLRRYGGRGQVAWIASPGPADDLDGPLSALGLSGLAILGPTGQRRFGIRIGSTFERRVKGALDPLGRFVEA